MKIKKFGEYIDEMAQISLKGKKVYADEKLLRDLTYDQIDDNLLIYVEKNGNMFWPKGKFYLYFTDSKETTEKMCDGTHDFLFFPMRTSFNMFNVAPITDVWKKKYNKKFKGSDHVLGMVEGQLFEKEKIVRIQMMSVRKEYKHNKMNSLMIDAIKAHFPETKMQYEDPTDEGYLFIKKYDPTADIFWSSNYRSKEWQKDHPKA